MLRDSGGVYERLASPLGVVVREAASVRFGVYSDDDIRRLSVVEVRSAEQRDALNRPLPGGLYDPKMGPTDHYSSCPTCGLDYTLCPGHLGRIELALPVYLPVLFGTLKDLLRGTCLFCHKFRTPSAKLAPLVDALALMDAGLLVDAATMLDNGADVAAGGGGANEGAEDGDDQEEAELMRGRRRRGEGASRGELSEAARAVLERAQRAHLPTPPLSAASRSPHINTLRKQTLSRFYRSLAASRKCASCGKHSPTIRHESGCKLFCAKLPRKLQEANAAISAARGGAGDSEEDGDADAAMPMAAATAATNDAEDEHGGEDDSDDDEEEEDDDDDDEEEGAAPRGATAMTAPRPKGAPRRAPMAEDAPAVDEATSGDGDDDDDDDGGGGTANSGGQPGSAGAKPSKEGRLVFISPSDAQRHLEKMWTREGDLLARLYRSLNAQSFFQRVVPVPPSRFRPPSTVGDGVFEPASNVLLGRVLAQDMELRRHLSGQPRYPPAAAGAAAATAGAPPDTERVLKAWEELCKSVQALTDSSKNAKAGSDREPAGVKLTLGCEAAPRAQGGHPECN